MLALETNFLVTGGDFYKATVSKIYSVFLLA